MAPRTVYLVSYRNVASQRAHFAVFVPSEADQAKGTLIHVVGAPMAGYSLEFKRNYSHALTQQQNQVVAIGQVDSANIVDSTTNELSVDTKPRGNIEIAASQVQPPRISENFMAPVNDTTNKRCQEWTMEFVRHLVAKGLIAADAIQIVQSKRDPPTHGIGLQPVGRR